MLDAFEKALEGTSIDEYRHRIEHAQILTQADLERLGRLGSQFPFSTRYRDIGSSRLALVIASVQPTHATSDMPYAETRLVRMLLLPVAHSVLISMKGPERIKGAYAYQTLLKYVTNGSLVSSQTPAQLSNIAFSTRVSPKNILPLGSDFPVEGVRYYCGRN